VKTSISDEIFIVFIMTKLLILIQSKKIYQSCLDKLDWIRIWTNWLVDCY